MTIVKGSVSIDITISTVPATMQTFARNSASGILLT
jgi:biotin transporter BioY